MGYLSQKKHQIREKLVLSVISVILTFFTLLSLIDANFDIIFPNLFQLYIFSFFMFIYSVIVKKYKLSLIFILLFIINYTALSSSGNVFLSENSDGKNRISLSFDKSSDFITDISGKKASKGTLVLTENIMAHYVKISDTSPLMIVKVNLDNINMNLRKKILTQLERFIIKQDYPVIIYGDFGAPSWNRYLRKLATKTRLSVKNRLLFTEKPLYRFFSLPRFYVFGFRDMGIDNINIGRNKNGAIITFDVVF